MQANDAINAEHIGSYVNGACDFINPTCFRSDINRAFDVINAKSIRLDVKVPISYNYVICSYRDPKANTVDANFFESQLI